MSRRDIQSDKTIRLPLIDYALLRKIAETEERSLRLVVARALAKYAPKIAAEMKKEGA
jgi:hypothetical protein